ncbi:MAG: hypothetical protein CMK07_02900 [Ponticaulis sp.]|nr:hypothetical protein [Ponticaulis sp.]
MAFAEDCTAPERPDFSMNVEEIDVQDYNDVTEGLIRFEDASANYRACLDLTISERSEGWVDALSAYNASSLAQDEVYAAYEAFSEGFMEASEKKAAEAAEKQSAESAEEAEERLAELNKDLPEDLGE